MGMGMGMGMSPNDVPMFREDRFKISRSYAWVRRKNRLWMNALFNLPTTSSSSIQIPKCFGAFDVFDVFDTLSSNKVRYRKLWFWTETGTGPSDHRPHFPLAHCLGFRRAWRVPKGSVLSPQHTKSSRWAMATWHGGNELRLQSCSRHHGPKFRRWMKVK